LLHAFYLDEKDSAISILKEIIVHPKGGRELKARSKLDLGDIYILTNESWESTLLYSQVEKSMKETPTGYDAKLRNAKLSYFNGDFKLAQEHLDILKEATTREISNDAMKLSLLIRDNTGMDSTEEAMREYASIELMLFQNKTEMAKASIDALMTKIPTHSLVDELLWMKADILRKEGNFIAALELLEKIEKEYFNDILGDDAYYLSGVIYEENLLDTARAMEIYNDFLTRYPGSVYAADARKRYRTLRGDFDLEEGKPIN
jgi:tetratricopeptide (TPR) repeat protein